jgi:hypothetical protein
MRAKNLQEQTIVEKKDLECLELIAARTKSGGVSDAELYGAQLNMAAARLRRKGYIRFEGNLAQITRSGYEFLTRYQAIRRKQETEREQAQASSAATPPSKPAGMPWDLIEQLHPKIEFFIPGHASSEKFIIATSKFGVGVELIRKRGIQTVSAAAYPDYRTALTELATQLPSQAQPRSGGVGE